MERPSSPIVLDGKEEFDVEAILRHCCAPTGWCGIAHDQDKGIVVTPKKRILKCTPITKYTSYIVGVGPLNNINERGPHLPPLMYSRV